MRQNVLKRPPNGATERILDENASEMDAGNTKRALKVLKNRHRNKNRKRPRTKEPEKEKRKKRTIKKRT